jgi:hypothetical protein
MRPHYSTRLTIRPLGEETSEAQREMQARLAYEELMNPPSRRQEGGTSQFERVPVHGASSHAVSRPGHSDEGRTWPTGEHTSHSTEHFFDFGLETSPRSPASATSRYSGFQGSAETARQSSGDDATADVKRRKNTEASGTFIDPG